MAISYALLTCLLLLALGLSVTWVETRLYREQSYSYCRQMVETNISHLDSCLMELNNMARSLSEDETILNAVHDREKTDVIDYSTELYVQREVESKLEKSMIWDSVSDIIIVGSNGKYQYYYGKTPRRDFNLLEEAWYRNATEWGGTQFVGRHATDYLLDGEGNTVSLLKPLYLQSYFSRRDPLSATPYLMCDFRLESVLKHLKGNDVKIIILHGQDIVYSPGGIDFGEERWRDIFAMMEGESGNAVLKRTAEMPTQVLAYANSSIADWTIIGIQDLSGFDRLQLTNTLILCVLLAFACALSSFLSNRISVSMIHPIDMLCDELREVNDATGHASAIRLTGSTEINQIVLSVNSMLKRIQDLNARILDEQQKLADNQLKMLQQQINPHFLNNVLQTIKAQAINGNNQAISRIATLLGKLLSYSVYSPYDLVTLSQELGYVQNYIQLQNERYAKKIRCSCTCDEAAESFVLPKMSVQPLVENAIEHGFADREAGSISIQASCEGGRFILSVANTGRGIAPDRLREINAALEAPDSWDKQQNIGLINVCQRLKAMYGDAEVVLLSQEGKGACTVISIQQDAAPKSSKGSTGA